VTLPTSHAPSPSLEFAFAPILVFSTATTEPPTGSQIRLNAGPPYDTVSTIWLRYVTADGVDSFYPLMNVAATSELFLQDKNDHTRYAAFRVTTAPVDKGGYIEYGVLPLANSGVTFAGAQDVMLPVFVPSKAAPPPEPAPTGPLTFSRVTLPGPLWTTAEVKALQLRITDAAHDADVAEKLATAQEAILAYLGPAGDATWTPVTAPVAVKHAILLLTVHYYEHRGDDLGLSNQDEAVVWKELRNLLMMYRDPAMA
jgi:Phage gp6-like head-tail connector protein